MFTKKQKKEYIDRHGNTCPYCQSYNIDTVVELFHTDEGTATQEVECYDCGKLWEEKYTLTDIVHEDEMGA